MSDNPNLDDGKDTERDSRDEEQSRRAQVDRIRAEAADAIKPKPRDTVKLDGDEGTTKLDV